MSDEHCRWCDRIDCAYRVFAHLPSERKPAVLIVALSAERARADLLAKLLGEARDAMDDLHAKCINNGLGYTKAYDDLEERIDAALAKEGA